MRATVLAGAFTKKLFDSDEMKTNITITLFDDDSEEEKKGTVEDTLKKKSKSRKEINYL